MNHEPAQQVNLHMNRGGLASKIIHGLKTCFHIYAIKITKLAETMLTCMHIVWTILKDGH